MLSSGDGARGVLVVGEAPGATEDEIGEPFVGKAGDVLRSVLKGVGVSLNRDAWATNAVICRPPKNKTLDDKQILYCLPNLLNTTSLYKPRVIVTLGRSALASVLFPYWRDIDMLERWVGWKIPLARHWVCPTYHPSYLMRMNNELLDRMFENHLESAFAIDETPPAAPDFSSNFHIVYDPDKAAEAIREMDDEGGVVAVDYETNCLKPDYPKAQIFSCAISNDRRTISYPWVGDAITATGEFLRSERTKKVASNLKFEERWTRQTFGWGVTGWAWDTMLAAHCLDNRPGITSIKFQALVKLGVPVYNSEVEPYLRSDGRSPYNRIAELNMKDLLRYGGLDALLEIKVAKLQRKEMVS